MSDSSLTAAEIASKLSGEHDAATRIAGGVRVSHPVPHPHTENNEKHSAEEEKRLKIKADHDAQALSTQVAELDAVHQGSVQQELLKHTSKAVPSTYHHPSNNHSNRDNHLGKGAPVRHDRGLVGIQQPSGKNGHNNFGH